jgi:hypothetical protein
MLPTIAFPRRADNVETVFNSTALRRTVLPVPRAPV